MQQNRLLEEQIIAIKKVQGAAAGLVTRRQGREVQVELAALH